MKNRFNRLISVICAIMLLVSTASVWAFADETPATPTDLTPVEEEIIPEEPAEEQQTELKARFATILHTFRPSRLPRRARWKPGYWLTVSQRLFDLQQRAYLVGL